MNQKKNIAENIGGKEGKEQSQRCRGKRKSTVVEKLETSATVWAATMTASTVKIAT